MTKEKLLNPKVVTDQEPSSIIYRAYLPFFRENVSNLKTDDNGRKYRLVEGAIIVDRRSIQNQMGWTDEEVSDHFTTLWEVDGFLTDVRKINFDFRHNGISTGAVGHRSWVVDDYEIQIDDKVLKVPARMLSVKVFEDNQIRIKGRNGETVNDGSLLENIENGRVFTWSVEFYPVRQATTKGGVTLFRSYHTPRVSFLDVTQGIPDAGGFTLRSFLKDDKINQNINQNTMSITIEQIKQALESEQLSKKKLRALLEHDNNYKRYLKQLVKINGKFGVVIKEVEDVETEQVSIEVKMEDGGVESVIYDMQSEPQDRPYEGVEYSDYILAQFDMLNSEAANESLKPTTDSQNRDIEIEAQSKPQAENDSNEGSEEPNPDQNGDGEISEEEMRSYVKEFKRMYNDPKEIKERMDDLTRMCDENKKRMDEMTKEPEMNEDEKEAQRIRALNSNLTDVPEEVETTESEMAKRSMESGGEGEPNQVGSKDYVELTFEQRQHLNTIYSK